MTRSQIQYILAVEQFKSFSKAAKACFITQSTLSALVAKFEKEAGIFIFDRKTKPITITKNGEKILKYLKNINREFQLLDEGINEIKGYETGRFSIACIPTVAPYLYPLILNSLSKANENMTFTVHEFTTERIIEEIIEGTIDVGIVSIPLKNKELDEHQLYKEDFLLYDCGEQSKSSTYKISDIDLDRLWLLEEGHCLRNQVGKICELRQQKKINGNLIYSCGSIFTLIEMVKQNKGVTLLPRLATANIKQLEKDHIFQLSSPVPTREIGIITHQNFVKKRVLDYLITTIQEAVYDYLPKKLSKEYIVNPF